MRISVNMFFILVILSTSVMAQEYHDFGFERSINIQVFGSESEHLDLAWTGGLNACQFHSFDLNFDGIDDLIVFDRHGNRLLTFINNGSGSEYAFSFAPEYIDNFPAMEHWVQFIDYNNDGKKDIFTYTIGGIKVYRNISEANIEFEQVTFPYLRSLYGNIQTNLLVTNVDYPAIVDLDSDGDLDILTFWGLGTFLEMHTNQSFELYGHSDSLVYAKTDYCWGWFAESDESNDITLDTCLIFKNNGFLNQMANTKERHTGSTLLTLDMTGNGLQDLILGDIDYPGLFLLENEGTIVSAYMAGYDTVFPANTRPVSLFSFPVANYLDMNNNGLKDLVVSTFDPSLRRSNHHHTVWLYNNTGTNEMPVFEFERDDLLQHRMIDVGAGAIPLLFDLDGDGLLDLLVSNYGYNDTCFFDQFFNLQCKYVSQIAFYKNTGIQGSPAFTLINADFANLSELGLKAIYPSLADIDNNGKLEMLIGNEAGNLLLFTEQSRQNGLPVFELIDDNYQQISVCGFSAPQLIDLNNDGLIDLVLGRANGKLSYYQNSGTLSNPSFIKVTDELGGVNVTDPMLSYTGHSIPHFFRDVENKLKLFVGSESGRILYFKDIDNNLDSGFTLAEERLLLINEGIRTAPALGWMSGNDFPDLIIGNYRGGLSYYRGITPKPFGIKKPVIPGQTSFDVFPNPASTSLTLTHKNSRNYTTELQVFDLTGRLIFEEKALQNPLNIQVRNWNRGLYLFSVKFKNLQGDEWVNRKKVMISD
ncbi:MAG: T9SS type A sorting domain-containing protein [Bacteroidales bacterium]|nr:T9SS type A sorting domain-containing protein [Bacteroidales bacterium]